MLLTRRPASKLSIKTPSEHFTGRGNRMSRQRLPANARPKRASSPASTSSLDCAASVSENCATVSGSRSQRSAGRRSTRLAAPTMSVVSRRMSSATRGCRTFTASGRPPFRAKCTCAMDPDATGRRSKPPSKYASIFAPQHASTSRRVYPKPCRGASACSRPNCTHSASGKRSARVADHWAHLMKAAPPLPSAMRSQMYQTCRRKCGLKAASQAVDVTGEKTTERYEKRRKRAVFVGTESSAGASMSGNAPRTTSERSPVGAPRARHNAPATSSSCPRPHI
mmetsp:Transcript_6571/g.21202  ORF Transcript_6571/g.21202 Transcript_6571/m.21202 type:complete len:281 (-) Transcript_6571:7-849(-)